jgi:hypothetical protein
MSCHWCGETDQRKLRDAKTYDGTRIVRCVKSWACHLRRIGATT